MTDGENCKSSMTRMLDGPVPEEHVPQPPHISAPLGREGFMHHRIQVLQDFFSSDDAHGSSDSEVDAGCG